MRLPGLSSAAAGALSHARVGSGGTQSMLAGGRDPSRVGPFYTGDTGSFAYLGVGLTVDFTSVLAALVQSEAFAANAPGALLQKRKDRLRARIQLHTPVGPERDYNDPFAKHVTAGAYFGEGGSAMMQERLAVAARETADKGQQQTIARNVAAIMRQYEAMLRKGITGQRATSGMGARLLGVTHETGSASIPGEGVFRRGRKYDSFSRSQRETLMMLANNQAELEARRKTKARGKERVGVAKGDPSGSLVDSIEVHAVHRTGAAFLHAGSLSYYAYFVEHGAMKVLKPMIETTYYSGQQGDAKREQSGLVDLRISRLGAYQRFFDILEARAQAFKDTRHGKFSDDRGGVGAWISWTAGSGMDKTFSTGETGSAKMFEKGFNEFMDDEGIPIAREFSHGFHQVWTGRMSARSAIRRLAMSGRMTTVERITTKAGQVQFRDPLTRRIASKPKDGGIDVGRP